MVHIKNNLFFKKWGCSNGPDPIWEGSLGEEKIRTQKQRDNHVGTRGKDSHRHTRGEALGETSPASAAVSDVPLPETGGSQPLLLEPPGLQLPKYTATEPPVVTSPAPSSRSSHLPRGFGDVSATGAQIRTRAAWVTGQTVIRCTNQNPCCRDDGTDGDQVHQSDPEL